MLSFVEIGTGLKGGGGLGAFKGSAHLTLQNITLWQLLEKCEILQVKCQFFAFDKCKRT